MHVGQGGQRSANINKHEGNTSEGSTTGSRRPRKSTQKRPVRRALVSSALHDRLDPRFLDQTANSHQDWESENRYRGNPSSLRNPPSAATQLPIENGEDAYSDVPWHTMFEREGSRVQSLAGVYNNHKHPRSSEKRIRKNSGSQLACHPPKCALGIWWQTRSIDKEEEERRGDPNLEGHLKMRDLRCLGLKEFTR